MAVKVQLSDDAELVVDADVDEMREVHEKATAQGRLLEIRSVNGASRLVNPSQIVWFEEASEEDLQRARAEAQAEDHPGRRPTAV